MSADRVHRRLVPAPVRPHPALHARRAPRRRRVARRPTHRVPPQPRRHRPGQLPVGRRRRDGRGAPRRRPRGPARRARRRGPAARGAGPARAGPRAGRRHHDVRHRRGRPGRRRSPSPGGCSSAGCSPARPGAARRRPGVRPATRSAGRSASPTSAGGCCASASSTDSGACSPAATTTSPRRSHGAAPTSSPPRRWTASAATGGAPTARALAVTRVDTAPVQRWHIADPADPAARPREVPYPAAGTANADVTLHVVGLDGSIVDVEWDRGRSRTSPTWRGRRPA